MTFLELKDALRDFRNKGLTTIKLNISRLELEAEYQRLTEEVEVENVKAKEPDELVKISQVKEESIFPFDPLEFALELETNEPEYDEPEILYDYDEEDATEDKLDDFLNAVRSGQLDKDQLEAVALAMIVAGEKHQNLSITLAQLRKFQLFTPNQLLAWGFDEVIPAELLFRQFRKAAMSQTTPQNQVNVNVRFFEFEAGNNAALLCAWAASHNGKNWSYGSEPGYQDQDWSFPELETAEKFVEYCEKLEFVIAVKIDRIATNAIIPTEKLVELGLAIA